MGDRALPRLRPARFRTRVAVAAAFLAVVVLAGANLLVFFWVQRVLAVNLDRTLLSIARTEIASALDGPGGRIHLHDDGAMDLALAVGAGYEKVAQIEDAQDRIVAHTANLESGHGLPPDTVAEQQARDGRIAFVDLHLGMDIYRAVYYPLLGPKGEHMLAVIGISTAPMWHSLLVLAAGLALSLVLGGAGAAWGADRLSRRLTRPLEQIASAARTVGGSDMTVRLPDVSPDIELRAVTSVLNEMLARLQSTFLAQRRFIADASHELRSPLANLRGNVEVTLRRPRSVDEYRETLHLALGEIERLSRLTQDLLTLSRADAGQFTISVLPCDLSDIARRALAVHEGNACNAGVRMRLDAPEAVAIEGDADRLREVADNLLDNALRYAPPGSEIVISVRHEEGRAVLSVSDTGPGISDEDQVRIFDRFYRADSARARQSGGSGLGLAIVRWIVEEHRGQIRLESAPGKGAEFQVVLPMRQYGTESVSDATPISEMLNVANLGPRT